MLLVDDDEPELAHGREERAARADGDVDLPRVQARPHRVPLARREARVEHGDVVAEAGAEARDELRRERDLRDEHDHARARLPRDRDRAQVHLRLARAGHAVKEERRRARVAERVEIALDGGSLRVGERGGDVARDGSAKNGSAGASRSSIATRPSSCRRFTADRAPGQRASRRARGSVPTARRWVRSEAARPPSFAPLQLRAGRARRHPLHLPRPDSSRLRSEERRLCQPLATSFSTGGSARRRTSPIGAR